MPIYEYVCEACGRLTEVMQRLSDPAPAACPECGASKLARLVSRTSFQLKGGGWYSDLYASPTKKVEGSGGGSPSSPSPAGAQTASAPAAGAPPAAGGDKSSGTG